MSKPTLEDKDYLTPTEATVFFDLSARKFYKLLKTGTYGFVAMYGTRKLIIKSEFEKYLELRGIKEALKKDGKHKKRL